jgi:hypothetical protein
MPFIVAVAGEAFEAQKASRLQALPGSSDFTQEMVLAQKQSRRHVLLSTSVLPTVKMSTHESLHLVSLDTWGGLTVRPCD